jgi:hypothetical protein
MRGLQFNREHRPHKIAAVFDDKTNAQEAEETLVSYAHFNPKDVSIIQPGDDHIRQKLEPEPTAIGRNLFLSHMALGGIGLLVGLLLAFIIITQGPQFAESSPGLTFFALGLVGLFIGLFAAGAFSLRPDHDPLINDTIEASRHKQWAVIVQARDRGDQQRARQLLNPVAVSVTDTF